MSDHVYSFKQRKLIAPMRWARNGMLVQAGIGRSVLDAYGHAAQYRRKVIFSKGLDLNAITTGVTGDTPLWLTRFRSGLQATQLHYVMTLAKDDHASAADPYVYWALTEIGGGSTDSNQMHAGVMVGSPDDTTDEFSFGTIRQDISPDTEYGLILFAVDYARPVACVVYEASPVAVDDALDGGGDPTGIEVSGPIYDTHHNDILKMGYDLWAKNAAINFSWSANNAAARASLASVTWTNAIDASTAYAATTAGFLVDNLYHDPVSGDVPVELSVYAERTAGAGTCKARINDGTNQLTTGAITTAGWYTVAGTIPAAAATKWDLEMQSDGSTTLKIWAAVLSEYEA